MLLLTLTHEGSSVRAVRLRENGPAPFLPFARNATHTPMTEHTGGDVSSSGCGRSPSAFRISRAWRVKLDNQLVTSTAKPKRSDDATKLCGEPSTCPQSHTKIRKLGS
jgi:hypothetical protein